MTFDEIVALLQTQNRFGEITTDEKSTPKAIFVQPAALVDVCQELQQNTATFFDMLSCVTGLDNGTEAGTLEVIYHLYSIPFNHHLAIKVVLPRAQPQIHTVAHLWKTADWHERETYDLLGIHFINHPDLRRILLPADWEGYPLRKDYQPQEYYRNIKVEY